LKAFGCARVVFNDGLAARQQAHAAGLPYITDAQLSARLTAVKATPGGRGSVRSPAFRPGSASIRLARR